MSKMRKEYDPNKVKQRKRKPIVYIICEGKETETLYFKHFRSRNCLVDIIPISSKHKAAEHLVKHAKERVERLTRDQVAVICRDSNPITTVYELVEFLNSKRI